MYFIIWVGSGKRYDGTLNSFLIKGVKNRKGFRASPVSLMTCEGYVCQNFVMFGTFQVSAVKYILMKF